MPSQGPESAPDVEEIAFTEPATGTVEAKGDPLPDRGSAAAGMTDDLNLKRPEAKADDEPRSPTIMAKELIGETPRPSWEEAPVAFSGSASVAMTPPEQSAQEQFSEGEPPPAQTEERSDTEQQPAGAEVLATPPELAALVESHVAERSPVEDPPTAQPVAGDSGKPRPIGDKVPADAPRDERWERERNVHRYLREVRAWVAEPPEFPLPELERQLDTEPRPGGHGAEGITAGQSDVLAFEPEVQPAAPRTGAPGMLEVQDLNLSIGTISIVVEEPKQAPALPVPPRVDRSPERPASGLTRLSRYYLGSW
jgi:hypothetical protein